MNETKSLEKHGDNITPWMELAVPLFSFGGAALAIIFWKFNILLDIRISLLGCVIASCILAYLAWNQPRKDIVALSTPIYSLVFLASPPDILPAIILELLYAVSLTILLVRFKHRYSTRESHVARDDTLAGSLKTYVERTRGMLTGTLPDTADLATDVFIKFAEGEYREAALSAKAVTTNNAALTRAFSIVAEQATLLDQSLPRPSTYGTFLPGDSDFLAISPPPDAADDNNFDITLDNALLLLFSAAWNGPGKDRVYLQPVLSFAHRLIESD